MSHWQKYIEQKHSIAIDVKYLKLTWTIDLSNNFMLTMA